MRIATPHSDWLRKRRPPVGSLVAELAITFAIVATLGTVATATYASYVRGSARSEIQTLLATAAQRQSSFIADRGRYADSLTVLGLSLPPKLEGKYAVAVTATDAPAPSFSITATATGDQSKDKCPVLAIDQAGQHTPPTCW